MATTGQQLSQEVDKVQPSSGTSLPRKLRAHQDLPPGEGETASCSEGLCEAAAELHPKIWVQNEIRVMGGAKGHPCKEMGKSHAMGQCN